MERYLTKHFKPQHARAGLSPPKVADDDSIVEAEQCAEARHTFRTLFRDDAIWLSEATGTLTHCALSACQNTAVFFGRRGHETVALMGWPSPMSLERSVPIQRARRFSELFEAFMDANFPCFDVGTLYGAFNLSSRLHLDERAGMVRQLCSRYGEDETLVLRALFGAGGDKAAGAGSVWCRAQYHFSTTLPTRERCWKRHGSPHFHRTPGPCSSRRR